MKKCLLPVAAFVAILSVARLEAADFTLNAGAGGLLGGLFTRYTLTGDGRIGGNDISAVQTQQINQFNYGGFLFFDATWLEFAVSIQNGLNSYNEVLTITGVDPSKNQGTGSETMLGLSFLAKYPFPLTKEFTIFPLVGVEYQISLSQKRRTQKGLTYKRTNRYMESDKNGNAHKLSAWNSLFIDIGVGGDFFLTEKVFLRGELLYGFRLMTTYEKDGLEQIKNALSAPNPKLGGLTSGPSLRISVGWRFFSTPLGKR